MDYKVYGDVLAFDATYRTNKYHCSLVVFSELIIIITILYLLDLCENDMKLTLSSSSCCQASYSMSSSFDDKYKITLLTLSSKV